MSISLHKKVLVLDKNYQPIRIVNLRGAIYLVFREAANVIDGDYNIFNLQEWIRHSELRYNVDYDFKALRAVNSAFGIPDVVILKNFTLNFGSNSKIQGNCPTSQTMLVYQEIWY